MRRVIKFCLFVNNCSVRIILIICILMRSIFMEQIQEWLNACDVFIFWSEMITSLLINNLIVPCYVFFRFNFCLRETQLKCFSFAFNWKKKIIKWYFRSYFIWSLESELSSDPLLCFQTSENCKQSYKLKSLAILSCPTVGQKSSKSYKNDILIASGQQTISFILCSKWMTDNKLHTLFWRTILTIFL